MMKKHQKFLSRFSLCLVFFLLAGCGSQVSFEKRDYHGHVRVESDGTGYCFKVPSDWEIREKLEGSDAVCLAPFPFVDDFRESVVCRSLAKSEFGNPAEAIQKQLAALGDGLEVLEPWTSPSQPVVVALEKPELSGVPVGQFLFVRERSDGRLVLLVCTTTKDRIDERRELFTSIASKMKLDLSECTEADGLPTTFPTPEVTMSPAPN